MPASHLHTALEVSTIPARDADAPVIVVAATAGPDGIDVASGSGFDGLADTVTALGFTGGRDEVIRIPRTDRPGSAQVLAVVGLPAGAGPDQWRYAAGTAIRQLAGVPSVAIAVPSADPAIVAAVLEGAALGTYAFTEYRVASRASLKDPVASITLHVPSDPAGPEQTELDGIVTRARSVGGAVALVKDLVNTPAADLYPESFAERAVALAESHGVSSRVWGEEELEKDGFGGILGVGRGSVRGPRLVRLDYSPAAAGRHLALVGKGITFDSGGLSLKPMTGMVGMKYDMTGAATVLAALLTAAELGLPVRVTAWLCLAENLPSGSAMRPNDVLSTRSGRTIEVLNTDAEGRLVLADGLAAASEEQPDAIVDVATLTGAASVALGNRYAAVMGEGSIVDSVVAAASDAGELVWPMPLPEELRATLNSDVADIANANPGVAAGGMLLAAEFLREFVGKRAEDSDLERAADGRIPWAHLDIAGPAKGPSAPYGFTGRGATGVILRTLVRLAEDFSRP
jgi:leucyl aminopeptidase